MTLVHCMHHDTIWITTTVLLDLAVALGYVQIALHWRRNERLLGDTAAKSALGTMKNIFLFCGLCGYLFIPVKMFWPAWRLYDIFLAILVYYTWRYALRSRELSVVYHELGRSEQLALDLKESREDGRRKSFFLNAISHDLKTPLNGLLLQAELAELSLSSHDDESLHDSLAQIKLCARTTADLLNSFLELGRLDWSQESLHVNDVQVDEVLHTLADQVRPRAAAKGLSLTVTAPANLTVRTDRIKLDRILANFADNALKFTNQGELSFLAEPTANGVTIHVIDTGEGIALEHLTRIFDDFTQVNNRERDSRKGFGLGLAIARRLARQLGGHLSVESEPGRGSRFSVTLPAGSARVDSHGAVAQTGRDGGSATNPSANRATSSLG